TKRLSTRASNSDTLTTIPPCPPRRPPFLEARHAFHRCCPSPVVRFDRVLEGKGKALPRSDRREGAAPPERFLGEDRLRHRLRAGAAGRGQGSQALLHGLFVAGDDGGGRRPDAASPGWQRGTARERRRR